MENPKHRFIFTVTFEDDFKPVKNFLFWKKVREGRKLESIKYGETGVDAWIQLINQFPFEFNTGRVLDVSCKVD